MSNAESRRSIIVMAGERWAIDGGRHVFRGPALLTLYSQVGVKKRRQKSNACKCVLCCGMRRRIGGLPPRVAQSGSDLVRRNRLEISEPWSHTTSVGNNVACPCTERCTRTAYCDSIDECHHNVYHSNTTGECGAGSSETNTTRSRERLPLVYLSQTTTAAGSPCGSPKHVGKREFLFTVVFYWLVGHALLSSNSVVQGAAIPSSSYFSSASSSTSRYQLVSPALNNDTIFIFFNPSSIHDLKINTRQFVYFNFTLYTRQNRLGFAKGAYDSRSSTTRSIPASYNDHHLDSLVTIPETGESTLSPITKSSIFANSSILLRSSLTSSSFSPTTTLTSLKDNHGNRPVERLPNAPSYWVMIYSDDDSIARPMPNGWAAGHADAKGSYILMAVSAGRQHNFSVEARHIGRVTMSVAVVGDKGIPQASYVQAVAATQYQVTTVRGERTADIVFNSAAAAIAIIISFGIGAITDLDSLKRQLKYPVALIIGFCCQFIIMPVLAFGMAMLLPLQKDISFGLLCVACVPGGGLSHVAVIIADGDTALSLTMNLITVVAMLGTAPLWLFVLGQYFQTNADAVLNPRMLPIYNFEIWLAATFFAYAFGLIIKRLRPAVADAILMWLIKPFLLLASILYITLGVYINMYVFELVNTYALLGAMLLPLCGFVVGATMAAICRQNLAFVKTIALETSSLNCLVVMVALRFSLKQPDADLAAMIPIWVMFTIPGLFVSLAICNKAKVVVVHYWQNRNNKDNDMQNSSKAYSVSSSVVSPPGTTTLSAPLVTADGMDDDATISTLSNQKVTVL
ncbi:hypothetical protein BgiMline_013320 [Biomphalaria glabrata]|nr:sodium/bile acid cotransporter 5 [Biomphalaria glabrata]